jgi:protocatechuate 3,4-dioxygenase alpha subunit
MQAPHISVTVYARGLLNHLVTRIYFEDEESNDSDPILHIVPAERRQTLIAARSTTSEDGASYRFDIILQGERETVFFDV